MMGVNILYRQFAGLWPQGGVESPLAGKFSGNIMKQINTASLLVFAALLFMLPSFAQDKPAWVSPLPDIAGDPVAGQTKSESCAACHGAVGLSDHNYYPNLAGQKEEYLLYQLHYYRSGERPHALMTPLAEVLSDEDIADISAFYASITVAQVMADEVKRDQGK